MDGATMSRPATNPLSGVSQDLAEMSPERRRSSFGAGSGRSATAESRKEAAAAVAAQAMQATKTGDGYVALSDAAEPPVKEPPNNQMLVDFLTPPVNIRLDSSGQHTLEWREPLTGPSRVSTHPAGQRVVTVPPGSLNLYAYPGSYSGPALDLIRRVLLEMAAKAPELFDVPDSVGAYALHALIVCNTEESLEVALSVVDKLPRLLLRTHDPPVFTGEGSLHIVCANRREAEACRMVDIAEQRLAADELAAFLNTQTTGVFFEKPPMCQYGDSPLSYACVFEVSARACLHSSTNHSRVRAAVPKLINSPHAYARSLGAAAYVGQADARHRPRVARRPLWRLFRLLPHPCRDVPGPARHVRLPDRGPTSRASM